jgi:hypothetical protein
VDSSKLESLPSVYGHKSFLVKPRVQKRVEYMNVRRGSLICQYSLYVIVVDERLYYQLEIKIRFPTGEVFVPERDEGTGF